MRLPSGGGGCIRLGLCLRIGQHGRIRHRFALGPGHTDPL
jgi:hypothetical protein